MDKITDEFPYVRGKKINGNSWKIGQCAGFSTAKDSNAFYRRILAARAQARIDSGDIDGNLSLA